MQELIEKVREFNKAFGVPSKSFPSLIDEETFILRHNLMTEEVDEYIDACYGKDLVQVADALGDKLYILLGTIIAHGMEDIIVDIFNEIHRSNMSKLDSNCRPVINGNQVFDVSRPMGKILKSSLYSPPNLSQFL